MNLRTPHSYQDVCIGTLIGAGAVGIAVLLMMGRKHRIPGYLHQSGEGAGNTRSSVLEHDEKIFREELANANS